MSKQFAASETPKRFQGDNRPPIAKILDSLSLSLSLSVSLPLQKDKSIATRGMNEFNSRRACRHNKREIQSKSCHKPNGSHLMQRLLTGLSTQTTTFLLFLLLLLLLLLFLLRFLFFSLTFPMLRMHTLCCYNIQSTRRDVSRLCHGRGKARVRNASMKTEFARFPQGSSGKLKPC